MISHKLINVLRESLRASGGISAGVWWNAALLTGGLLAMSFDHRRILGLNPWVKPIKFDISVIVFLLTAGVMLWALGRAGRWGQSRRWIGWGFGTTMIVENSIISLQSLRGVRSHMNYTTPLDGILFGVMGLFIILNTALAAWLLALWSYAKAEYSRVIVWGVRLGLVMLLVASAEGVRMVMLGGHTVGATDGGSGLPFTNWSTAHGDLRVAHFFGLHALQLFPLAALALSTSQWHERVQVAILLAFAAAYSVGVWWLFAQAMRGIPALRMHGA